MVILSLKKKFFRGLKANAIQLLSIVLMLILGVTIYIGIDSTWRSLEQYKIHHFERERNTQIEMMINPQPLTLFDESSIHGIEHVTSFEALLIGEANVINLESSQLLFHAVNPQFTLNQFKVIDGSSDLASNHVVLDASFAAANQMAGH